MTNKISEDDWSLSVEQRQEITTATGEKVQEIQEEQTHNNYAGFCTSVRNLTRFENYFQLTCRL